MGALSDAIADRSKRRAVVDDGVRAIEAEVASKRGVTGLAVKGAFKVVRGIKPGFIGQALDHLLDDFAARVDPFHDAWKASGTGTCEQYFVSHKNEIAEALLGVTDDRAKRAKNKALVKTYSKLRPQGVQHVTDAMPRVGALVAKHTA